MSKSLFRDPVFQNFVTQRPIATAAQMVLRRILDPEAIDQLFHDNAQLQYEQTLLFSTLTRMMTSVALGVRTSVNAAYKKMDQQLAVSVNAVYNKLQRIEPQTSNALVRHSYNQTVEINKRIGGVRKNDLPGYQTNILDGNHLAKTQHRIKQTRNLVAGPLPGKSLVVFDPRHDAILDFFAIEDGHAQELSALDQVIETLRSKQLWIADRNFCTLKFLYSIAAKSGCFVIRQHGKLHGEIWGKEKRIGKTETGVVYENKLLLPSYEGKSMVVRRVVAKLFSPTRDGDEQIVILTNLPSDEADATKVSELYRGRWKIETAFMHMTVSLNCEVETLCYPPAALFCFATALLGYNAISVIKTMIGREHGRRESEMLSHFYVASELVETTDGLLIAFDANRWNEVAAMSVDEFVPELLDVAKQIDMKTYRKSVRGPKKPPPKKKGNKRTVHVSTKRLLEKSKVKRC